VAAQMDCGDLTECPGLGQCVDTNKLCDKTANCKDKSDEAAWYCNPLDCSDPDTTVECVGTDYCVKPTQVCDGIMQCPGAIDESPGFCLDYRSSNCNEDQVKCTATAACTKGYMCDGVANCPKIKNASTGVLYAPDEDPKYCAAYSCLDGFQKCSDELQCVLVDAFCDGKKDCLEGLPRCVPFSSFSCRRRTRHPPSFPPPPPPSSSSPPPALLPPSSPPPPRPRFPLPSPFSLINLSSSRLPLVFLSFRRFPRPLHVPSRFPTAFTVPAHHAFSR
ncbi:unnamed protein product, partial [Closterium sp. NIES-53]